MTGYGLTPETVQRFAGSLLHFIWQGTAVALAASICLRFFDKRSAALRYAVSVAALALMLTAPVVTFVFYAETGAVVLSILEFSRKTLAGAPPPVAGPQAAATVAWTQWILFTWSIGVLAFTARLVTGWCLSYRLVSEATTVLPDSAIRIFENLKHRMELSRPLRLRIHAEIDTPMVVGCLKPVVLIPLSALTGLNEEQLTAVLAHELAHIRRHDFFVNLLQRSVESLLFYHPGVWWLSARIRNEREHCCDDIAIGICGDRGTYIQALVELERKRQTAPALSVAANGGNLIQRVHRLLGLKTSTADWQSGAITLLLALVWMIAASWYSPSSALQASPALTVSAPAAVVVLPATASPEPVAEAVIAIAAIMTASPVETQQSSNGAVSGTVRYYGSSEPIPNVHITLFSNDGWPVRDFPAGIQLTPSLLELMGTSSIVRTAPVQGAGGPQPARPMLEGYTDADGRFLISKVPPGQYGISVLRDGFVAPEGKAGVGSATVSPFEVLPGQTFNTISVFLVQGRAISGTVRDSSGNPAAGIRVSAFQWDYHANTTGLKTVGGVKITNDRGEYRLFGLLPGEYIVGTVPPVEAAGEKGPPGQSFFLNTIDPRTSPRVVVQGGADIAGINIELQKIATSKISGRVINLVASDSGQAVDAATSFYLVPKGDWRAVVGALHRPIRNSEADPTNGRFELQGVTPGLYDLVASIPASGLGRALDDPRGGVLGRTEIVVSNDDINGATLTISPGVDVKARITYQGGTLPSGVTPSPSISLQEGTLLFAYSLIRPQRSSSPRAADREGITTFPNTNVGRYRFDVSGLPPDASIIDVREGGRSVYDTGLTVGESSPGLVEIIVNLAAGGVDGTVVSADQQTVSGVRVVLVPAQASRRGNLSLYKRTVTDLSGRFTLRGVAPGEYKIFSWESLPSGAPYSNSEFMSQWEARGQAVTVSSAGVTAAVRVQVIPNGGAQ